MSTSERIRALRRAGLSTSQIAVQLGIRYQHAYNVLRGAGLLEPKPHERGSTYKRALPGSKKALLRTETLVNGGFRLSGAWLIAPDGKLALQADVPSTAGVYAFVIDGTTMYVGVATVSVARRLYSYTRPGPSQLTNRRLNNLLLMHLAADEQVEVYVATPPDIEWNGLPVNGSAGLELGLIKRFKLPWNSRSAR